jgi:DNA-binding PadR family transcriptional regulator
MLAEQKLSHTAALILQAIHCGYVYGYNLMETTGLPSGTIYPALRRLQQDGLIRSHQERPSIADAEQRPPRKYYKLTPDGETTLQNSLKRYPLLARLVPSMEVENV